MDLIKVKESSFFIFINIFFIIIMLLINFYLDENISLNILSGIGWILMIIQVYCLKKTNKILKKYFLLSVYLIINYLFLYGQILIYPFVEHKKKMYVIELFNRNDIIIGSKYSLIILIGLFMGIFFIDSIKIKSNKYTKSKIKINKVANIMGKYLVILTFIPFCYKLLLSIKVILQQGYIKIYSIEFGIFGYLSQYFLLGIIYIMISKKNEICEYIIFLIIILGFLQGSRTESISLVILLIYWRIYNGWKISIKILLSSLVLIMLIPLIFEIRNDYSQIFENFPKLVKNIYIEKNVIFSIVEELGGSMMPTISTMKLVPLQREYLYGESILDAIMKLVPSIIRQFYYKNLELGDTWLTRVLKTDYGLGFSLGAESFLNFGYFGYIYSYMVGIIFGKLLKYEKNNIKIFLTLPSLIFLLTMPRRDTGYVFIQIWYFVILPYLILKSILFLKKKLNIRKEIK